MPDNDQENKADTSSGRRKRVALGVCGGIAAYKAAEVLRGLQRAGCDVRVAMTRHATQMIAPLTFRSLSGAHVIVDDYAPDNPDPIAHITFSQTIALLLVAPATANIIAKFANGIADDFLSTTYLACQAPVLIAPAMNTTMWQHPATVRNLERLRADGVHIIEPDSGEMACGTIGPGRLSEPDKVVVAALAILNAQGPVHSSKEQRQKHEAESSAHLSHDLSGEHILITTGGTREEIDPVRFISNRSSGRMGFALAEVARARGAGVTVIAAATSAPEPQGVNVIHAMSAEEMRAAVLREIEHATIFISAAAVADYRPATRSENKIKKSKASLTLTLEPTPDILVDVARARRDGLLVIGFAAESDQVLTHARDKLIGKQLDAIIANDITRAGAGFDTETNIITILTRGQDAPIELPLMSKREAAQHILDEVARMRRARQTAS